MLLILNCMVDDNYANDFNESISRLLNKNTIMYETVRMREVSSLPDISAFTHLIISGSEASALDDNQWDKLLIDVIHGFIRKKRPVLGICYGHQFLARALLGKEYLRKRLKPEIGWIKIEKINGANNELFNGINEAVSTVIHYDEVVHLTDDFHIIASTTGCPIHSFQYKDLPVWGIQFHPEYDLEQSKKIFTEISKVEPNFSDYFVNDLQEGNKLRDIENVIYNFLKV